MRHSELDPIIFKKPRTNERESAWIEHIPFAFFTAKNLKPNTFVELGTHYGTSYFAFCEVLKELPLKAKCYAVDHWKGDLQAGYYTESVYDYVNQVNEKYYRDFSTLLKMPFDDALNHFDDGTIDLLHIDGLHDYESVKKDFHNWLPKMSENGVVLLHDTQVKSSGFGVWKLFEELKDVYKNFEFSFGYGLGIVCTGKDIPNSFETVIDDHNSEKIIHELFRAVGKLRLEEFRNKALGNLQVDVSRFEAQIFYKNSDESFSETKSKTFHVTEKIERIAVDFPEPIDVNNIRFDPLNGYADVTLNSVQFRLNKKAMNLKFKISSNAIYMHKNRFMFDTDDPQIYFKPNSLIAPKVDGIDVELTFHQKGIKTLKNVIKHQKKR